MNQKISKSIRHCCLVAVLCALNVAPNVAFAQATQKIAAIQRESRIVADVMASALRTELSNGIRVSSVSAEYLARQGVLISVKLNAPWLIVDNLGTHIEINGDLALEEIPSLVKDVLADLEIDVERHEPETLATLRVLREEQRALRTEQRTLRANLRQARRDLVQAKGQDKAPISKRIADLELGLQALEQQSETLTADIDRQYETLKDQRKGPDTSITPGVADPDINLIVAQAVCDYATTLNSLDPDDYVSVIVRRNDARQYLIFEMGDIRRCNKDSAGAAALLAKAIRYEG